MSNTVKKNEHSSIRVCSLGSGSKGNATLFAFEKTLILVDCGFSSKELEYRLSQKGILASEINAILVTHEHGDHFNGVGAFSNKYQIPVWMSHGTGLNEKATRLKRLHFFNSHQTFNIGQVVITPVSVPHDAREACQFVFRFKGTQIGILTDLGHITPFIEQHYSDCDILLLEFNHEPQLLINSRYPASLKARVSGPLGHLSNQQACQFLIKEITRRLKFLVAMHLSEENNCEDLVRQGIANCSLNSDTQIIIAEQASGFDWLAIDSYQSPPLPTDQSQL